MVLTDHNTQHRGLNKNWDVTSLLCDVSRGLSSTSVVSTFSVASAILVVQAVFVVLA